MATHIINVRRTVSVLYWLLGLIALVVSACYPHSLDISLDLHFVQPQLRSPILSSATERPQWLIRMSQPTIQTKFCITPWKVQFLSQYLSQPGRYGIVPISCGPLCTANMEKASSRVKSDANDGSTSTHIGGRIADILIAFTIITVPMILFSALLLGLVYHYRVVQNTFSSENLEFDSGQDNSNVFFVKISATTLIAVASWCSTTAPILTGFALTLISYPVASSILSASEKQKATELPTPYQLSLLLRMLSNGSISSLWVWLKYSFGWKGRRQSQGAPIKALMSILTLSIILRSVLA